MSNNAGGSRTNFSFITYENEADIKQTPQTRKAVRSHVTRVQHRKARLSKQDALERVLRGPPNTAQDQGPDERHSLAVDTGEEGEILLRRGTRGRFRRQDARTQDSRMTQQEVVRRTTPSAAELVHATAMERRATRETMLDDPADHMAAILGRLQLDFPTVMVSLSCTSFHRLE